MTGSRQGYLQEWVTSCSRTSLNGRIAIGILICLQTYSFASCSLFVRLLRRKTKMFRFTPTPVSSASLFWWTGKGGFAEKKCSMNPDVMQWYDENFPPLSIYYGGQDHIVTLDPLLERFERCEPHVKLIRVEEVPLAEHCDFYWAGGCLSFFHTR